MSREQDAKIAEWLGQECNNCGAKAPENCGCDMCEIGSGSIHGFYSRSNADAITLLPVLVEKLGQDVQLWSTNGLWGLTVNYHHYPIPQEGAYPSICEAITSAIVAIIDKGAETR